MKAVPTSSGRLAGATAAALLAAATSARADILVSIEPTTEAHSGSVNALSLSADGSTVAGYYKYNYTGTKTANTAFTWTPASATVANLGTLTGNASDKSSATGISGNGSIAVGTSDGSEAFVYTSTGGMIDVGNVNSTTNVRVSDDGSTLIATNAANQLTPTPYSRSVASGAAGAWTPLSGFNGQYGFAGDVSTNGSVISGSIVSAGANGYENVQTYRWTAATGPVSVGPLTTHPSAYNPTLLTPISPDGNVIAAVGNPDPGNTSLFDAYIFNATTGTTTWLNASPTEADVEGNNGSFGPTAVTDGGEFVAGQDGGNDAAGWIWSQSTGVEPIASFLEAYGLNPTSVGGVEAITDMTLNGNTLMLIGYTGVSGSTETGSFYAQVTVPEPASLGLIAMSTVGLLVRRRRRA